MNCTQETYHACLATVAPREVRAARMNGVYAATWKKQTPPNEGTRRPSGVSDQILTLLPHGPLTAQQLRSRIGCKRQTIHSAVKRLECDGLITSSEIDDHGVGKALWRMVETP